MLSKHSVCIVDDEPGIGQMFSDYLKGTYDVTVFTSPARAVQAFESEKFRPDVLVTDIKMPVMTGFEMARKIHESTPGLPVVVMSGYADKGHVIEAIESQAFGFLEKPFSPKKMKSTIDSIIERNKYVASLETVLNKYSLLTKAALELNRKYVTRYARAENCLDEANLSMFKSREEVAAYLLQIKDENQLNFKVDALIEEIRVALKHASANAAHDDF